MKKNVILLLIFAFAVQAFAQEVSFSGNLTAQTGIGLPNTHDNKGKFLFGQTIFDGTVKAYFDNSMVYINGQVWYDALGGQATNGFSSFTSDNGYFALFLKEAYMDWKGDLFALRIGRQIAAWGKADEIQIADILCPKDEANSLALKYKDLPLGIDAVRFSVVTDNAQADVYWIPFFTPSTMPLARKNPFHPYTFPDSMEGVPVLSPSNYTDFDSPEKKLSNSEYAVRGSLYTSHVDLSVYGFYGWDDLPFMKYMPVLNNAGDISGINIQGEYRRMAMIGADAAVPVGDFVLRFECAYFPNRHIQTSAEYQKKRLSNGLSIQATKKSHQIVALAGFDWSLRDGWTVTAQYIGDVICNYHTAIERNQFNHQATLSIEKPLLNETLVLSASGALDLRDLASTSELEIEWKMSDSITLGALADFFLEGPGGKEGLFGEHHDLCCVTLRGKISF